MDNFLSLVVGRPDEPSDKKERGPRSLFLRRCENGFGFTLRHFIVYPPESYTVLQGDHRWGLRQGDQGLAIDEPMDTIFVKNVRESSPAHAAGLSTGDRIIAVNGQTITSYTYAQVVQLIQQSGTYLHLLVVPKEDDILQRYFGETAHNPETNQRPLRLKSPEVLDQRSKTMIQHQQPALSTTQHHQHHHHHHHHHHHQQHNQKQHQTRPAQQDLATYQEQHHSRRGSEGSKREGGYGQVGRDYSRGVNPYYSGNSEWREDMVVIGNHAQPVVSLTPSSDGLGNLQYGSSNSVPAIYYPGSRLSLDDGRRESSVSLPNAGSNSDINTSMSSLESTSTLTGGQDGCSSDDSLIMSRIRKSFEQKEEFLRRPNQPISWNLPSSPNNQQSVPLSPRSQAVVAREFYARPQKFQRPLWPPQNPSTIATTNTTCRHQSPPPRITLATVKTQNITNKPTHLSLRRVKSDIDSERDSLLSSSPLQSRDNKPFERASSEPREDHNKVLRGQFLCGGPVTNAPTTITNQYQDVLFRPIVTTTGSTGAAGPRHGSGKTSFVTTLSRIHENIPAIDSSTENTSGNYTSSNYSDNLDNSVDNFRASSLPPSLPTESDNGLYGQTSVLHEEDAASDRYTAHPKLQLVSRRARQFETGQLVDDEEEGAVVSDRTSLYRSELSRLSAKKSVPNVAVRKREFESRSSSGNSSLRDGRRTHRESRSLESAATSQQPKMVEVESSGLSGNRSIPIGSKHLHCTPPRDFQQQRTEPPSSPGPYDDISGPVKLRARSNSAESWAAAMVSRGLQASRNTLEWPPQRALQGAEEPQRHKAVRQDSYLAAVRTPVTSERLGRLLKRQTALPMETPEEIEEPPYPKPTPAVRPNQLNIPHPIRPASALMPLTAAAVVSQERISGLSSVPSETSNVDDMTPVVVRREKNCSNLAEEERLVRRVSYLKATWGDRMHVDSDFDASDTEASYVQHQTNTAPQAVLGATLRLDINKENFQLVKEGWLHCKITIIDGKRAGDRSWKQVWAVLRGPVLYLFKDRRDLQQTPLNISEGESSQSVDVRHSQVDIAGDYTKKKHVLRLNTQSCSELLLQAEDASDMAQWIKALQDQAGSPAEDCSSGGSTKQQQGASSVSTSRLSPLPAHKGIRKLTSFRNRSPTGQSPVNKTRKPSQTDQLPSPKSKTWKGRVAKQFRRIQQGSGSPSSPTAPYPEGVTIGIPLEDCPMSPYYEFVPLLVQMCTSIVEERGLDIIGIYRVPGNTAAVSSLTEGINKGFDCVNLQQDPRWSDVNVISSLLKLFFRRLPDSLLTTELYPHFIEADKIDDSNRRLVTIKKLVHELPDHHFETLKFLLFHLKRVVDHCDKNKMEARNLAIVFGPTLVRAGDDNMVTMVTDMSHQCRIVESLITHVDWFFSDEDPEDSFPFSVPQDGAELEPATANQNLLLSNIQKVEGMKAESPSRDISAKDIVSSIISAANRKMQKAKSRKGGGGGGGGGGSSNATSGTSGATEDGRETFTETMQDRGDDKQLPGSKQTKNGDTVDVDRPQQSSPSSAVAFSVAYSSNIAKSITTEENSAGSIDNCVSGDQTNNPSGQSMLDDSSQRKGLVIGNDEVAVWTYANLSANTQERIKRFERETKAMLQRDLSRQRRDMEKHEADKKRIEQELQQAKKDLENEDLLDAIADNPSDITKNISDTISHTGVTSRKPPTRDIKYNLSTIGRRLSSSSLPSTSSNTSFGSNASYVSVRSTPLQTSSSHVAMDQMDLSTKGSPLLGFTQTKKLGTTHFFPEAPRGPNTVTISPRNSLPSSGYSSSTLVGTRNVQQTPNRSSTRSHSSLSTVRVSLPGPEKQSLQRSGSVENLQTQLNKLTHNGTLKRMKTGNEQLEPQPNLTSSLRCGSLDSLHEVFGNEGKDRPPSDISDDGSDLLASLTSTFDRKLKSLLNNNSSSATPEEASDDTLPTSTKKTSPVKSQVYRDPSLHRGSSPSLDGAKHAPEKVEAVAKKAETPRRGWSREKDSVRQTKETSNPSQVSEQCNKTVGNKASEKMGNTKENKLTKNETKSKCSLDEKKKGQPETKLKRSESLNKPEKQESPSNTKLRRSASLNKTERSESPSNTKLKRSDSLTKTEKTESNISKRRQQEMLSGSRGNNKEKDNITIIMTKLKRKNGMPERSIKRRHTVGGTKDFDKVNWLDNRFQHQLEDNEAAATNPIGGNKERRCMRTSSPDLSSSRLSSILAQEGFRVEISLLGNGRVVAELTSPNGRPHSLPDANLASRVFKVPLESHV